MSNTNGTTNATVIAQKSLEELRALLPVLSQMATDHSDEKAKYGETIIVHEVAAAEAAAFNKSVGYVPTDRSQVDIPVALNQHVHHTYYVDVTEASTSRVDLIARYAKSGAYAIGAALVNALCGLVTAANFTNKSVVALGAGLDGFDRKSLVRVGTALDTRKVAPFGRFMLLNPSYYGSLMSDNAMLTLMMQAGASAAQSGKVPNLHGFAISQYSSLPDNSEDLVGFAGTSTALAIATRIPDDPGVNSSNCSISVATDPETGMSIQVREWYEATLAQFRRSYTLMFGVAKGQGDCLQRITSK